MIIHNKELTAYARALRKNMTPWERRLWYCYLRSYQPKFMRQKVLCNYIADFYCAKAKLAIELEGSGHFTEIKRNCDVLCTEAIEKLGIKVIRFNNNDVHHYFDVICSEIDREVKLRVLPAKESKLYKEE